MNVAYLRVSTDEQVDNGTGLDIQLDAITELAGAGIETFTDEGESGSNGLETRLALGLALDALAPGDTLYVYRLDRLARDLVLQEQLLADVWRRGASVVSCSAMETHYLDPDDRTDPSRTLIRQVLGAVAEYERKMIALRMQTGRRRKIALTGYAGGPRPYGWTAVDGALVPDPDEQAVLRFMADQVAAGYSYLTIANELNARGIPKAHGPGVWVANQVHRQLMRATKRWEDGRIPDEYRIELPPRQDQLAV